jgi:4-hydroxy-tetrahydrodipicolinate reductase
MDRKEGWTTRLEPGFTINPKQVQVSVSRVGEVPGVHGVGIDGPDDRIELRHEARSRRGFAVGAIVAAEWLDGRSGVFTLADMADDLLGGTP